MRISSQSLGVIHFVGIGGIGMSGVAEILNSLGYSVRGSDLSDNKNVQRLRGLGISIVIGQKAENVDGASVVVISSAIQDDNEELVAARKAQIPVVKRAEMLAEVMRMRPCITVAGTHGKTTTTSIAATVLDEGGLDPTVVSGGIINAYGTNARLGSGAWMLVEADESDGTFSKLPATIAIVTNIEAEHMNYYGSFDVLKASFQSYLENIPFYGLAILCGDHPVTNQMAASICDRRVVTYGIENEDADMRAVNIRATNQGHEFDIQLSDHARKTLKAFEIESGALKGFSLPMMGYHNILNAMSVLACGLELGMTVSQLKDGLVRFMGVERRFTILGDVNDIIFVDDYAHHPTEIKATLSAARHMVAQDSHHSAPNNPRVIAVVQPHRYSRLADLFTEFSSCFQDADQVIVMPVFAAGEMANLTATHATLAKALEEVGQDVITVNQMSEVQEIISDQGSAGDLYVFMGAGDISAQCQGLFARMGGMPSIKSGKEEKRNQSVDTIVTQITGKLS